MTLQIKAVDQPIPAQTTFGKLERPDVFRRLGGRDYYAGGGADGGCNAVNLCTGEHVYLSPSEPIVLVCATLTCQPQYKEPSDPVTHSPEALDCVARAECVAVLEACNTILMVHGPQGFGPLAEGWHRQFNEALPRVRELLAKLKELDS